MYVPDVELHEPATIQEAATLKARYAPDARLLAGGTDLLVDLKTGRIRVGHVISLNRVDVLPGLSEVGGGLRIGALTTIRQLGLSPIVRERFSPIIDATSRMAAPQIRNVATVGGNIACAVPCADLPPILTAMNASVVLRSPKGQRSVSLETIFVGPRQTILRDDEVLTAILVPKPPSGFGAAYARFALRNGNAVAVAAVAASLTLDRNGTIRNARVVLGAVAPVPKLIEAAATGLVGQLPQHDIFIQVADVAMNAAEPISDVRGSADYRREIVGVLARRALTTAYERAKETVA